MVFPNYISLPRVIRRSLLNIDVFQASNRARRFGQLQELDYGSNALC